MDSFHAADEDRLAAGVRAVEECNSGITARQAPTGDLGQLHQSVSDDQTELDRLQGLVDDATSKNASAWETFDNYMHMISDAPACPSFPSREMTQLDVYFEKSEYVVWFAHQELAYATEKGLWVAADAALSSAIESYNIQKAIRDTQYCDWKHELKAACTAFDACFATKSDDFNKRLVPGVQLDMEARIENYKAGETIIHQIKFLLAEETDQETPAIATSRYEVDFPTLPPKAVCDLSLLDDAKWVPQPTCSHQLLDGCGPGGNLYDFYGSPRMEVDDRVAGEAVCCTSEGKATRNLRDGQGLFNQGLSHEDCTTTSGTKINQNSDSPSHNYHEAQAICEAVGLRLCRNQEELDTACNTGCHINFALAWVE